MTITATLNREKLRKIKAALEAMKTTIERADTSESCCMCGSPMTPLVYHDNHSPIDMGDYYADQALDQGKDALQIVDAALDPHIVNKE